MKKRNLISVITLLLLAFSCAAFCGCASGKSEPALSSGTETTAKTAQDAPSADSETEKEQTSAPEGEATSVPVHAETTVPEEQDVPQDGYVFVAEKSEVPVLLTGEDLRAMALDYFLEMASVVWTSNVTLDYSAHYSGLVFQAGETYIGMPYNAGRAQLEQFLAVLENGVYTGSATGWSAFPGNSCSTSIRHAWERISPSVAYDTTIDALPLTGDNGVIGIGEIDWTKYDGKNTKTSLLDTTDEQTLFEAYALLMKGDALIRYEDGSGHMMMVSDDIAVVRRADGTIDPNESVIIITDQNVDMNHKRGYVSSWGYMRKYTFSDMRKHRFLPVTVLELRDGVRAAPALSVSSLQDASLIGRMGILTGGNVLCNYYITKAEAKVVDLASGETVKSGVIFPFAKTCAVSNFSGALSLYELKSGRYRLTVDIEAGNQTQNAVTVDFTRP